MMCPDCSPPTIVAVLAHVFEHVTVAHGGARKRELKPGEVALQAENST
jgi:hypothetical protein